MTAVVTSIKPDAPPTRAGFVETESAQAMLRALRRARTKGRITVISGGSGVGKSKMAWHFKNIEAPTAILVEATAGEGGILNLARQLCDVCDLKKPDHNDLAGARLDIAEHLAGGFIFIEKAQYLVRANHRGKDDIECFEWARSLSELGCIGLAFVGDLRLDAIIHELPQLKRRSHPRVTIPYATENDVSAFVRARGVTDAATLRDLARLAKRGGGLGEVADILETAQDMADGAVPTATDIELAIKFTSEGRL